MHLSPRWLGLGCCLFLGGGSVVVGLLFNVLPIVCGSYVFVFVKHYFVSILVLAIILNRKRKVVSLQ